MRSGKRLLGWLTLLLVAWAGRSRACGSTANPVLRVNAVEMGREELRR